MKQIHITLSDEMHIKLKIRAATEQTYMAKIIKKGIDKILNE